MYPLSPNMDLDLEDDEKDDEDMKAKSLISSTKMTRIQSSYREDAVKAGHITAST